MQSSGIFKKNIQYKRVSFGKGLHAKPGKNVWT